MKIESGKLLGVTNDNIGSHGRFTVPKGVTSIGIFAFEGCTSLTTLTIFEGIISIEAYAFLGCASLTTLTIPEGITRIGGGAFNGCASLKYIVVDGNATKLNRIKALLPPELHSKVVSKQRYIAEENRQLDEATGLPADLIALMQEFITPVKSREIKLFVAAEARAAEARAAANQSFRLNCLISIGLCSTLALASLIVALKFPPLELAGGITAAVSLGAGLTAYGLYKRSRSSSGDDLVKVEDDSPALSV